jgi:LmbE family N-acetylglucosaminyl deacetylase
VQHFFADPFPAEGKPRVDLSFLNLPAGAHDDLKDRQPATLFQMLADGAEVRIDDGERSTSYHEADLIAVLRAVIEEYDPDRVLTLNPIRPYPVRHSRPTGEGAHPDHVLVAKLALRALVALPRVREIRLHDDYPIQDRPANLSPAAALRKTAILKAYCAEDRRGCADPALLEPECEHRTDERWGEAWLCRHYPLPGPRPLAKP